jgi:hypothetical protein
MAPLPPRFFDSSRPPRRAKSEARTHAHDTTSEHWLLRGLNRAWVVLVVLLALQSHCPLSNAAVLRVSSRGAGQFTNVQAALDAAAPSDTLVIMQGTYTTTTQRYADHTYRRAVGWVEKPLTILGEGLPVFRAGTDADTWAFFSMISDSLTFSGLLVQDMDSGIRADGHTLVDHCAFDKQFIGLVVGSPTGRLWIRDCTFNRMRGVGVTVVDHAMADMRRCNYSSQPLVDTAMLVIRNSRGLIADCQFRNSEVLEVQGPSSGLVRNCIVVDAASDVLQTLWPGATIEARNLRIHGKAIGPQPSTPIGLAPDAYSTIVGDSLLIDGCYAGILAMFQSRVTLRDSQITNWTNSSVKMLSYLGPDDVVLDLVGNYWGLTDSVAIAQSIFDGHDDPRENPHGFVSFWPIVTHSVPTPKKSIGEVKARFSQSGR